MTFAEKVLARKTGKATTKPGETIFCIPDLVLIHDLSSLLTEPITQLIAQAGIKQFERMVIVFDRTTPALDEKTATEHKKIRELVQKYGVKHFFDIGTGICYQVMVEKGLVLPGTIVVGSASHICSCGAVNAFTTPLDPDGLKQFFATGDVSFPVPATIKVNLKGRLSEFVTASDLMLTIIKKIGTTGAANRAVEFHGDIAHLTMDDRLTIANMSAALGATVAVFPADELTRGYLAGLGIERTRYQEIWADKDATYSQELTFNLNEIVPMVAGPHKIDNGKPVNEVKGLEVHQCLIGTCASGRTSDFAIAARIISNRKISPKVRLLLLPASKMELEQSLDAEDIHTLIAAGGILLPPGCGPCLSAHQGILAPGERCLATANQNFPGKMGSKDAEIYLASPATVAASALTGKITDPRELL